MWEIQFYTTNYSGEFVVLNICDRIGVRVPVDFSILVTWRTVSFAVAG